MLLASGEPLTFWGDSSQIHQPSSLEVVPEKQ